METWTLITTNRNLKKEKWNTNIKEVESPSPDE